MPRQRIEMMGKLGLNSDVAPYLLPAQALTKAFNVITADGSLRSTVGEKKLFDLQIKPRHHTSHTLPSGAEVIVVSDGIDVHVYTMDGTMEDITPVAGAFVGGYVSFVNLNGVLVVNSWTDGPYYWPGTGQELLPLPGWDTGWLCREMVAYRYYLVALGMTESGTEYPHKVRWSNSAAEGELPTEWVAAESNDAGADLIGETQGHIVGARLVRDALWIVKEDAIYDMRWIGGEFIMQLSRLTGSIGTRLQRGFAEVLGGLAVFTTSDLLLFDGTQSRSLVDQRIRNTVFASISDEQWDRSELFFHKEGSRLYLMGVEAGFDRLSTALVYSVEEDTWGSRKLNYAYGVDSTIVSISSGQVSWDEVTTITWDEWRDSVWNKGVYQPSVPDIVIYESSPDDTAWWVSVMALASTNSDGTPKSCIAERTGIPVEGFVGSAMISEVRPEISADIPINIWFGAHDSPSESPRWTGPFTLNPGDDQIVTPRITGRYLCYRIESFADGRWSLGALNIYWEKAGER